MFTDIPTCDTSTSVVCRMKHITMIDLKPQKFYFCYQNFIAIIS